MTFEELLFSGGEAAVNERERRVSAEDHASLAAQTVVKRPSETFYPNDRGYAERDAEKEDAQAAEPAAQVAERETRHRWTGARS
jgi:hypothetical protein